MRYLAFAIIALTGVYPNVSFGEKQFPNTDCYPYQEFYPFTRGQEVYDEFKRYTYPHSFQSELLSQASVDRYLENIDQIEYQRFSDGDRFARDINNPTSVIELDNCQYYDYFGIDGLVEDFEQSLKKGLSCMLQYRKQLNEPLTRLTSVLLAPLKPIKIKCGYDGELIETTDIEAIIHFRTGDLAVAFTPDTFPNHYPGIAINVSNACYKENEEFALGNIFHELVHLAGYIHPRDESDATRKNGIDLLARIEQCCFYDDSFSCYILENLPGNGHYAPY